MTGTGSIASGFSWFHLIPSVDDGSLFPWSHGHAYTVLFAWLACALLIGFALIARAQLAKARARQGLEQFHADERLSFRTAGEVFVDGVSGMMAGVLDRDDVRRFLPLIGGIFAYVLVCNAFSLLPGFQPPTDNANTNVGLAVIVVLVYWGVGLARDWKGFVKHILGPVPFLIPLIFVIEMISLVAVRPATLTIRLTANIFGDHTVFNIMSGLLPALLPVPFLGLGIIVAIIQAFVFALLTTIYIGLAVPHHADDHGEAH